MQTFSALVAAAAVTSIASPALRYLPVSNTAFIQKTVTLLSHRRILHFYTVKLPECFQHLLLVAVNMRIYLVLVLYCLRPIFLHDDIRSLSCVPMQLS